MTLLGILALLIGNALAGSAAATAEPPLTRPLSAPYAQWDVSVAPFQGNARTLEVDFNSPLMHRRVTNLVYLPDSYAPDGVPSPVLYYLHGTVLQELDNPVLDPVTKQESLLYMVSAGGGYRQTQLMGFQSQLSRARFVVVAPDANPAASWCHNCGWIDGRSHLLPNLPPVTGEQVPGDTFLHQELYPLIEHLFNVRTDRAGRGVSGFSMGGYAAMIQGMKHPDDYAFVGSVSGVYEILTEPRLRAIWEALGYLRDQGYGTGLTEEVWWRNYDPSQLATNLAGTGTKFLLSYGDACLSRAAVGNAAYPPLRNPAAASIEFVLNANNSLGVRDLAAKGIPVQVVTLPGVHGANDHRVYSDYLVAAANDTFTHSVPDPATFSYRTVNPTFSVWGYDVSVHRSADEFLSLDNARRDGTSFTVTGTGQAEGDTPATFAPGSTHQVVLTAGDGSTVTRAVTADGSGRLPVSVDLGPSNLLPQQTLTDALALSSARTVTVRID
ncbi:hypothetical protein BA062_38630 [Prauserella flavalba]|uniref:Esterase n=1 Tax=Prauserella flavalba TaxID=1477506 RepID=A0A318L8G9_9PSEU|nr:hypothetical protein BA062_38630 [Prauserella flavalba]